MRSIICIFTFCENAPSCSQSWSYTEAGAEVERDRHLIENHRDTQSCLKMFPFFSKTLQDKWFKHRVLNRVWTGSRNITWEHVKDGGSWTPPRLFGWAPILTRWAPRLTTRQRACSARLGCSSFEDGKEKPVITPRICMKVGVRCLSLNYQGSLSKMKNFWSPHRYTESESPAPRWSWNSQELENHWKTSSVHFLLCFLHEPALTHW